MVSFKNNLFDVENNGVFTMFHHHILFMHSY